MKPSASSLEESVSTLSSAHSRRRSLSRWMVIMLSGLLLLLISLIGYWLFVPHVQPFSLPTLPANLSMADIGLANWQDYQRPLPTNALTNPALPQSPAMEKGLALLEDAAGRELLEQGQLERGLAYQRAAALADPENLRITNDYRLALRNHGRFAEEEAFFARQAQASKTDNRRINLALAYVDEMRACPRPPDGLVCQAQNSSRSISLLSEILAQHPYNIIAHYARGLNHLYWPSLMGHLPKAQVDLQYAIALLHPLGSVSTVFPAQAYTALGDVFAKEGQIDKARNIWLNGKSLLSHASLLDDRLNLPQDQLTNEENNQLRGLGVFVETDLVMFWQHER